MGSVVDSPQAETVESVVYRMLDRVIAAELVPAYVRQTVEPYMREMGLDADRTLFRYVDDLTQRCGKIVSCFGDAPWEAKAIQIIRSALNSHLTKPRSPMKSSDAETDFKPIIVIIHGLFTANCFGFLTSSVQSFSYVQTTANVCL